MPIYREYETVFLTIDKSLEITEADYELFEQVSLTDEEIARLERNVGKWHVSERAFTDELWDPSMDYIGLMESYLAYIVMIAGVIGLIGAVILLLGKKEGKIDFGEINSKELFR